MRMMSAGKQGREKAVVGFIICAAVLCHIIAYLLLKPELALIENPDKATLLTISGCIVLTFSLMMSQAMELVTRVFYSRSDLDLILSSPTSEKKVFAVRIAAIAAATSLLPFILFGSVINILAFFDGPAWLSAYLVIASLGALATAASLAITILLFKTMGAKRTRLISQIVAAIVGAGFIIGIQISAIASLNSVSRISFFQSDLMIAISPHLDHWIWVPAKGAMGSALPLLETAVISFGILLLVIVAVSGKFGEYVVTAAGVSQSSQSQKWRKPKFRMRSTRVALILKEWKLLLRDHWLISQTLMQVLYLAPPAYMLWQGFGGAGAMASVALPVMVMATGQLAGGLAWLAISGEDAPQLVQTAPIARGAVIQAKVEAVLGAIGILVSPVIIFMAFLDLHLALIAVAGTAAATVSATMIQLWFRSQANRSSFRRRQTSSKVATLSEAFSSILWAGATGLLAVGSWLFAPIAIALALVVLWTAHSFKPEQDF